MQTMSASNKNNKSAYRREKSPTSITDGTNVGLTNAKPRIPTAPNNGCMSIDTKTMSSIDKTSKPMDGTFDEESNEVRMRVVPIAAVTVAIGMLNLTVM